MLAGHKAADVLVVTPPDNCCVLRLICRTQVAVILILRLRARII